jgi:hypothetical protein
MAEHLSFVAIGCSIGLFVLYLVVLKALNTVHADLDDALCRIEELEDVLEIDEED